VGAKHPKTGSQPWILFPFCSQIAEEKRGQPGIGLASFDLAFKKRSGI
jgi:hypothetical protein